MSLGRRFLYWAVLSTAIALGSCGGKADRVSSPDEKIAATDAENATPAVDETLARARDELARGKDLAERGFWIDARLHFDAAIDSLLELPDRARTGEAKALYDEVLAAAREMEAAYLAEQDVRAEQEEGAAVDELTELASEELSHLAVVSGSESESETEAVDLEGPEYDLPIVRNARVESLVRMYKKERREWFQEALDRSAHFMPMFREVFREEGLPLDLVYLSMVESAFKTRAVSRAGARGLWQFIRGTGRRYGLSQDFWIDDRFDPEKATRAAARHLKDLHEKFGDWYLAMAAYNCGERRVERAIRRTGSRDFWTLAKRRRLPRETRSYVPLILAAVVIAKEPEAHGFRRPEGKPREFDVVKLEHPVDLKTAAEAAELDVEELKLLNAQLRRWVTPLDRKDYELRVPKGAAGEFRERIAAIPKDERVRFGSHTVRRGDSLSRIARRYGTSVQTLAAANQIRPSATIYPGQVLTVPVPPGTSASAFVASDRDTIPDGDREVYVVRRGDTLGEIARSFRMSLASLRALNDMGPRASRIYPGQRLVVVERERAPSTVRRGRASAVNASGTGVYVVRPGDTLGAIAEAHGMGLSVLRRLNGFSSRRSRIYPGQRLVVREIELERSQAVSSGESFPSQSATLASGAGSSIRYVIRRGDTLSRIARHFGVSVAQIREWNDMATDRIVAGDSLTIHLN